MRRSDSDLLGIAERELDQVTEDELLRLVVITRDGARKSQTKRQSAWAKLVERDIDRVRGIVATFRHKDNPGVRVHPDNVNDVTQDAYLRLLGMAFRGTSIGEYRNAMRQCVIYQCMDHCRREMGEDKKRAGSLDDEIPGDEGDTRPKFDKEIAKREERRVAEKEELERLAQRGEELEDAIAQIPDDRKRRVLEMTRDGRTTQEIMDELDESKDNVYQLRRRALELVRKILDGDRDS